VNPEDSMWIPACLSGWQASTGMTKSVIGDPKINTQIINIEGIGGILFEKSKHARRVGITVRPKQGVRVRVPNRISFETAQKFALSKKEWIKKQLTKIEQAEIAIKNNGKENQSISDRAAKEIIVERTRELSELNGFIPNQIIIRRPKTRWGSCSSRNNINLNIKLAKLPKELMDYVILHELVHTRIKNHSNRFWQELDSYVPNARKIDRDLNSYYIELL
jgi:predicted metal-dependent hydrolase